MLKYLEKAVVETTLIRKPTSRRAFLGGSAAFALAAYAVPADAFPRWPTGGETMPNGLVEDPMVFVSIDTDGTVTLVAHRSEMGTGSRTSLPMKWKPIGPA
jgi:isoquinoline 1-oxidoreductase beta subunit